MGCKLVEELRMEPGVDTLSRWMAHYLAELINAAETAPQKERAASQKICFDAILELWSHRAEFPNGKRPFEELEPIMRSLKSLDPDDKTPRFFRSVRGAIVERDEDSQTQSLLEFVCKIDSIARILIGHALSEAARSATDKSKEWLALAEEAGAEVDAIHIVTRYVSSAADGEIEPDTSEHERELLQNRIDLLEAFAKMAALVSGALQAQLETVSLPQEASPSSLNDQPSDYGGT